MIPSGSDHVLVSIQKRHPTRKRAHHPAIGGDHAAWAAPDEDGRLSASMTDLWQFQERTQKLGAGGCGAPRLGDRPFVEEYIRMRSLVSLSYLLALAGMLVGAWTSTAHAYLDPGTGSIILQVLLGGVAGLALACKLYWQKLLTVLGIRRKPADLREIRQDQG